MADGNRTYLLVWAAAIVAWLAWVTFCLLVVDGWARRLVGGLVSSEVVQDRSFDRFHWLLAQGAGGGRAAVVALCQVVFVALSALAPMLLYARFVGRMAMFPEDAGSRLFFVWLPVYMAWLLFFFVAIDPLARRFFGAALGARIGKEVWVSTFNWRLVGDASGGRRALVGLLDVLVTGIGYLLPAALGVLQLLRAHARRG
ncbi:MAG: hypothetical protein EXR72_04690 [Myxococcales bacterium]|nr:hypothetical protein [Myxococcales bacterium]